MTDREITRALASYVARSRSEAIPQSVRHEALRSIVNWVGCALGGARHEAVTRALAALRPFSGAPRASIIGRSERLDALNAALVNGMSSHVLDFDDTHLRTLLHPSVAVAPALLALAETRTVSGTEFVHAFVVGVEVATRVANAIYTAHNVNGYITGTAGVLGGAAAAGRVLGLDAQRIAWALGIAATQAAGLREMAGTMCKSFVHGRAAQNGLSAALLAASGFTSSAHALEAPRGLLPVLSGDFDAAVVTAALGERYELTLNTYKPHACGVVVHPAIDGCIALRDRIEIDSIRSVALRVNPLALKLAGIREPQSGLESKWSVYHAAAVAFVDGAAGEHQFGDARVFDTRVAALRSRVTVDADPQVRDDEAYVTVTPQQGAPASHHVEHALGSVARPMTDADLSRKFERLAKDVLKADASARLVDACWNLETLRDVAELMRLASCARR